MTTMFVYVCVMFGLVSSQVSLMDFFQGPCPMGCLQSVCLFSSGCTGSCQDGWCKYYGGTNVGTICTPRCSQGQSCSSWGYCTRDRN